MTPHLMKLLGLSAALLAINNSAHADTVQAPTFSAEPCCQLCPEAHDASRYTTRYQQNFTTLVQAQGDWLFRTREDLRTEFQTTPLATNACNSCMTPSRHAASNWWWSTSRPVAW